MKTIYKDRERPKARTMALPLKPWWARPLVWLTMSALALILSIMLLRATDVRAQNMHTNLTDQTAMLASDKADDDTDDSPTKFA